MTQTNPCSYLEPALMKNKNTKWDFSKLGEEGQFGLAMTKLAALQSPTEQEKCQKCVGNVDGLTGDLLLKKIADCIENKSGMPAWQIILIVLGVVLVLLAIFIPLGMHWARNKK